MLELQSSNSLPKACQGLNDTDNFVVFNLKLKIIGIYIHQNTVSAKTYDFGKLLCNLEKIVDDTPRG